MIVSVNNLLRRVARLEAQKDKHCNAIRFKMIDGTFEKLPRKDYLRVCGDALYGITSPQTDIVRNAVSCDERGRLLELFNSCMD